jgi:hypothetical protein
MSLGVYTDVHVPSSIVEGLRRRGIDVVTSQEDGTREVDDATLLARSAELDRVLFTQDHDLLQLAAAWQQNGREFSGLVFAHQLGPGIGLIIEDLELLANCAEPREVRNHVWFLPLT